MWAGGKKKLLKKYEPHLPDNFTSYHEPFFGGGAMFVWAYNKNPNATFYINDINEHIIGIYKAIRDDVDNFCANVDRLQSIYLMLPGPKDEGGKTNKELEKKYSLGKGRRDWEKIFNEQRSRRHFYFAVRDFYAWEYEQLSKTKEAATLYFLMKTGFNGVWQLNNNTNGRFGTPCGLMNHTDKVYDKDNVMEWHEALQNCKITSGDYKQTLGDIGKGSYVFLDPPYRGGFADYGTEKDDNFQEEVIQYLNNAKSAGSYCMLSNRDMADNFFEDRKLNNEIEYFDVTYTVGRRKKKLDEQGNVITKPKLDKQGNPELDEQGEAIYEVQFQEAVKAREILMIGLDSENKSCYINNTNKQECNTQ